MQKVEDVLMILYLNIQSIKTKTNAFEEKKGFASTILFRYISKSRILTAKCT